MDDRLQRSDARHLCRRLAFAGTEDLVAELDGLAPDAAFERLWSAGRDAPPAPWPGFLERPWTNAALALAGLGENEFEARREAQRREHARDTGALRRHWLAHMVASPAPLREQLVLFFHDLFGSSSETVGIAHALAARNARYARHALGSFPELLEALVLDPAMMIQIGMDGHGPFRVSDRPAVLILEHWTVGAGEYAAHDVGELSRALTGWTLGDDSNGASAAKLAPGASRAASRAGLVSRFDAARFEAGPKTLLGSTADFDARSAVRRLALAPATARRVARRLLEFFGVAGADSRLSGELERAYLASGGEMHAVLGALVGAEPFWSDATRWSLIKSPVHLAVGACRQLGLEAPAGDTLAAWLREAGQTPFDTPDNGEGGWPRGEAWISPPERLAVRYRLPAALAGRALDPEAATAGMRAAQGIGLADGLSGAADVLDRLDPAPGLDVRALRRRARRTPGDAAAALVELVMATPHYQLA